MHTAVPTRHAPVDVQDRPQRPDSRSTGPLTLSEQLAKEGETEHANDAETRGLNLKKSALLVRTLRIHEAIFGTTNWFLACTPTYDVPLTRASVFLR